MRLGESKYFAEGGMLAIGRAEIQVHGLVTHSINEESEYIKKSSF